MHLTLGFFLLQQQACCEACMCYTNGCRHLRDDSDMTLIKSIAWLRFLLSTKGLHNLKGFSEALEASSTVPAVKHCKMRIACLDRLQGMLMKCSCSPQEKSRWTSHHHLHRLLLLHCRAGYPSQAHPDSCWPPLTIDLLLAGKWETERAWWAPPPFVPPHFHWGLLPVQRPQRQYCVLCNSSNQTSSGSMERKSPKQTHAFIVVTHLRLALTRLQCSSLFFSKTH